MDKVAAQRGMPTTANDDPTRAKLLRASEAPMWKSPKTATEAPSLAKLLSDNWLPKRRKSNTASPEASRVTPNTASDDPTRAIPLRASDDPSVKKSTTDNEEAKRE
jgi:hypothetical protein